MAARHSKMCSWTWPGLARKYPNERVGNRKRSAHHGGAAAALVPDFRILAPLSRPLLLADRADDHVGIHSDFHDAAIEFLRTGRRYFARGRHALGRAVPRPDRTR